MQLLDTKFVRESFKNILVLTLDIAKNRTIVKNNYGNVLTLSQICDEFLTFKIKYPKQIGKTALIKDLVLDSFVPSDGFYLIDVSANLQIDIADHNSVYRYPTFYLTTPSAVDIIKNNIYAKPNIGHVFIIDSESYSKQTNLKTIVMEIFQEYNKDKSNLEKIYPAFVIID